ncbi:Flagellar hook-basal body complex protein FliE 1 [uncultured Alphaproteobacteria bacterium]|uniref:Flagellar hook-basal body complex protein FliE n=1 Tax=uncultured Alphaproteobacteria bacterium TaxID=91750 RepID=A0A212JNW3_9PROT|nr:Flagellar hook-basal body complex protein FliE 1 [uncultured Alphaproteobacteria bacterium]
MTIPINSAVNAYRNAAGGFASSVGEARDGLSAQAAAVQPGQSFADLVKDNLNEAIDAGKQSEKMSLLALQGKADLREVVNAVANAETALQTVVAVRDKVLSAYQDILKMSI